MNAQLSTILITTLSELFTVLQSCSHVVDELDKLIFQPCRVVDSVAELLPHSG